MRFGMIKFFAHQLALGCPIPLFVNNDINRSIERHARRIYRAKTRRVRG